MGLVRRVDPILTGGLRGGLLAAARPLPKATDWKRGITFTPECGGGGVASCVAVEDAVDKTINGVTAPVEFSPFIFYHGVECSTWIDTQELLDLATRGLTRSESKSFAQQLQSDPAGTGNPTLNSTANDISGGVASPLINTMCGLMDAICDNTMSELVFHAPVRAMPMFLNLQLALFDGEVFRIGPHKIVFDCYGTTGPDDSEGVVAADDEAWIYVTGPIEVESGTALEQDGLFVPTNERVRLAEKLGILRFDTCAVQAALAQVC